MFVKRKPNRSGSTTVVVAEKEKGATKYLKTIGTSSNPTDIAEYVREGEEYVASRRAAMCPELDFEGAREQSAEAELKATEEFLSRIENVIHDAPKRILDRVFDAVGFHAVDDDIFRSLVIARLSFPSSKRATVEYLKSHFDEDYDLHKIYRYLDSLNDTKREEIQAISVRHTMEVHGGKIGVLFYDVTTLYFDSDKPDKLREPGYSKDGKHSNPQNVLGLLVSGDGCPLAYSIHEGSKYEGHTMLPVVTDFVEKYGGLRGGGRLGDDERGQPVGLGGEGLQVHRRREDEEHGGGDQGMDPLAGQAAGRRQGAGPGQGQAQEAAEGD